MKNKLKNKSEDPQVLSLVQDIKDGRVLAKTITKETRLEVVEFMMLQGQDTASIAQFLKVCDKTIRRDLEEIRSKNSISPNPSLVKILAGEMFVFIYQHRAHLMRLSRSKEGSVGERVQAEYLASKVFDEGMQRLQSLGYLPTQPQALVGSFYHNMEGVDLGKAISNLEKEILDVEGAIDIEEELSPEEKKKIRETKKFIENIKNLKEEGGEDEELK